MRSVEERLRHLEAGKVTGQRLYDAAGTPAKNLTLVAVLWLVAGAADLVDDSGVTTLAIAYVDDPGATLGT